MSLTITGIPDCKAVLGPSQYLKGYQLQPGTADYPAGGYVIPGSLATGSNVTGSFEGEFAYGAWETASNAAGSLYGLSFIPASGSFGTIPGPSSTLTMLVTLGPVQAAAGIPLGLGPVSAATSTTVGVATGLITVAIANTLSPGNFVYLQSFTAGGALNGEIVQVVNASATQFTAYAGLQANITAATADVTGTFQLVQAATGNLLTTGASATITHLVATAANPGTSPSTVTVTCANTFVAGQFVVIQGVTTATSLNGAILQIATASTTQFTAVWKGSTIGTAADTGTAKLLVTAGGAPVTIGTVAAITNSAATASSAGTAGVATLTAVNSFVPGNIVVTKGLVLGSVLDGGVSAVIATGLTSAAFEFNGKMAVISSGADAAGTSTLLVTGAPTSAPTVAPGTDLSGCSWFAEFLTSGE